jgi:hypothetical protein
MRGFRHLLDELVMARTGKRQGIWKEGDVDPVKQGFGASTLLILAG